MQFGNKLKTFTAGTALTIAALLAGVQGAQAVPVAVIPATQGGASNVASQLGVNVAAGSGNTVAFTFTNAVGIASSITDVYFDQQGSLLSSLASITFSAGVAFSADATPPNLPGGNNIGFTADFSADSNSGNPGALANGVNQSNESLTISFNLAGGNSLATINSALTTGALVVGLHVQGIAPTGSSSSYYTTNTTTSVPEPATLAVLGAGLLGLGALKRRKQS